MNQVTQISWPDCRDLSEKPAFRKATLNMILATEAVRRLNLSKETLETAGLIVRSRLGELLPTLSFLQGLASKGTASPIHFQNSLHHSTLGFVSMYFGIQGPGICINSAGDETELEALAIDLVMSGQCRGCVLVDVNTDWDGHPCLTDPSQVRRGQASAWWFDGHRS